MQCCWREQFHSLRVEYRRMFDIDLVLRFSIVDEHWNEWPVEDVNEQSSVTYRTAALTQLAISLFALASSMKSETEIHAHLGGKRRNDKT